MALHIFLLGIIIGSFLNVCIYRIPREESIIYPSSHCTHCSTPLKWHDLIPIFSFLLQRGKCRYCRGNISLQYPVVELLNGVLYSFLFQKFETLDFVFLAIIFSLLIVITFIDLNHKIIPHSLNILILINATVLKILRYKIYDQAFNIVDSLLGLIIPSLLFLLIILLSKGGMGGGDLKLIGVLGYLLGIRKAILIIFLSFISGGIISLILLLFKIKARKDPIPFGPFISLAFMFTVFWGEKILCWYIIRFY